MVTRTRSTNIGTGRSGSHRATRPIGREVRALAWLARHPLLWALPIGLAAAIRFCGIRPVGIAVGVLVLGLVGWWRAYPASFDRWAAPWIRSGWRRWTAYRGGRWASVLGDCELTREHRRTGQTLCPRVLRVRSVTPSIDTVVVRMVRGQDLQTWTDHVPALADALAAHRVAVTRRRPGVLTVVVERPMPFTRPVDPALIPATSPEVDLTRLDVGDDEYGAPFTMNIPASTT